MCNAGLRIYDIGDPRNPLLVFAEADFAHGEVAFDAVDLAEVFAPLGIAFAFARDETFEQIDLQVVEVRIVW